MLKLSETPEETAHRCAVELWESVRRAGRAKFRYAENVADAHITLGVGPIKGPVDEAADLPPDLRKARPSMRKTYRALRAMWDERKDAAEAEVWPSDVVAWLDKKFPDVDHSLDTVNHALKDLRTLRLAWVPDGRGWRLGSARTTLANAAATLPISVRQSEPSSTTAQTSYADRMAGAGARRVSEVRLMSKSVIWVPGEKYEGVVAVMDPITEEVVAVSEKTGTMKVPTRSGKLSTAPAARGELVRVEGKYAVVKFSGGKQIKTRVLGDWHLAGHTEPQPEEAEREPETADVASAS